MVGTNRYGDQNSMLLVTLDHGDTWTAVCPQRWTESEKKRKEDELRAAERNRAARLQVHLCVCCVQSCSVSSSRAFMSMNLLLSSGRDCPATQRRGRTAAPCAGGDG